MSEEDLMVEYLVANYNVTREQAQQMFQEQKECEEQAHRQAIQRDQQKGLGGIQLGKKQNKKKEATGTKKKPVLFQRLLKQLEGQKKVVKKKEVVKVEELEFDETKFT